jgi:hypothetical protein
MRQVFEKFLKDEDLLCYFDPDITVKCRWSFFEEWVQHGLALVEDATFPYLPSDHPLRFEWMEIAKSAQLTEKRRPSRYYNGGFGRCSRTGAKGPASLGILTGSCQGVRIRHDPVGQHGSDFTLASGRSGFTEHRGDDNGRSDEHIGSGRHGFQWRRLRDVARGELAEALGQRIYEIHSVGTAADPSR